MPFVLSPVQLNNLTIFVASQEDPTPTLSSYPYMHNQLKEYNLGTKDAVASLEEIRMLRVNLEVLKEVTQAYKAIKDSFTSLLAVQEQLKKSKINHFNGQSDATKRKNALALQQLELLQKTIDTNVETIKAHLVNYPIDSSLQNYYCEEFQKKYTDLTFDRNKISHSAFNTAFGMTVVTSLVLIPLTCIATPIATALAIAVLASLVIFPITYGFSCLIQEDIHAEALILGKQRIESSISYNIVDSIHQTLFETQKVIQEVNQQQQTFANNYSHLHPHEANIIASAPLERELYCANNLYSFYPLVNDNAYDSKPATNPEINAGPL